MAKIMPLPAKGLSLRLKILSDEFSSWASYLPRSPAETETNTGSATLSDFVGTQVTGHVWQLSLRQRGSRAVQEAIELCSSDAEREAIAKELNGHIWEAVRCPHANFVVQRLIVALRPCACQFIIEEILRPGPKSICYLARHKYGCRTLQRLLEHCSHEQTAPLAEALLSEVVPLSRHPYGNYVLQQLLEHGSGAHQSLVIQRLLKSVALIGADSNGVAVLLKALANGSSEERVQLALALNMEPGLILSIARSRYGHAVAQLVVSYLPEPQKMELCREVAAHSEELRASRYGRLVLNNLESQGSPIDIDMALHSDTDEQ
ncbi:pum [Symbiodinium pilosum]|uniref:Pum protein n=1 Tax=Symbiodinium pilosum TaxID=2952 RepID=A0A812IWJ5_SYMPI|nr:pum [Symbiodinium pilosum]